MIVLLWKYDAPTVAAYLLHVRLTLRAANALTAYERNVVAGVFCATIIKIELNSYRNFLG
jgi:hypothetical protein